MSSSELAVQVAAQNVVEMIKLLQPTERTYVGPQAGASGKVSSIVKAAPEKQAPEGTTIVTALAEGFDGNSPKVTRRAVSANTILQTPIEKPNKTLDLRTASGGDNGTMLPPVPVRKLENVLDFQTASYEGNETPTLLDNGADVSAQGGHLPYAV
jgi:hypothetical protein